VDSKYSNEKPGRARRKTCLDQYKANKATNANGGLRWLQKGGGYYSQEAERRGVDWIFAWKTGAGLPRPFCFFGDTRKEVRNVRV
jgi:hypothetical protein